MSLLYTTLTANLCALKSPEDLVREGERLKHRVGSMNYEQRIIREDSLIFFIRDKTAIDTPLATVEYSPKTKRILQCYGENNSLPETQIMNFVNKQWLPYANRQIKKLQTAA